MTVRFPNHGIELMKGLYGIGFYNDWRGFALEHNYGVLRLGFVVLYWRY